MIIHAAAEQTGPGALGALVHAIRVVQDAVESGSEQYAGEITGGVPGGHDGGAELAGYVIDRLDDLVGLVRDAVEQLVDGAGALPAMAAQRDELEAVGWDAYTALDSARQEIQAVLDALGFEWTSFSGVWR